MQRIEEQYNRDVFFAQVQQGRELRNERFRQLPFTSITTSTYRVDMLFGLGKRRSRLFRNTRFPSSPPHDQIPERSVDSRCRDASVADQRSQCLGEEEYEGR